MWVQGRGQGWTGRLGLTYVHVCVKQIPSGSLLYSTGNSALCSVVTWLGGMGVGVRGRSKREGIIYACNIYISRCAQSCPTLCNPVDCSPPCSSVHGTFQARIPEWVAISSSRGSSWPRDWIHISYVSCIGRWILYHTMWEAQICVCCCCC